MSNGLISSTILRLYQQGIVVEPAGALGLAGIELIRDQIKGKSVICIVSGGTVDINRVDEFKQLAYDYEQTRKLYLIELPARKNII